MNCQTAESMVNRYIEHDLSVDELEDFLEHVENCPSCYDEQIGRASCRERV